MSNLKRKIYNWFDHTLSWEELFIINFKILYNEKEQLQWNKLPAVNKLTQNIRLSQNQINKYTEPNL